MHRLLTMPESPVAYEFVRRLNEASIPARLTTEHSAAGLHTGFQRNAIIWIDTESDSERAGEVYRELLADHEVEKCPVCGYSLSGHSSRMRCPECGYEAVAQIADSTCPRCHETVPSNFDICWNCGEPMKGRRP